MPELPEVETVRLQLLHKARGKTIAKVTVYNPKTIAGKKGFAKTLQGLTITNIDRVGKLLIWHFADSSHHLLAHLKMTGQFLYVDKKKKLSGGGHTLSSADTNLPNKHTRVSFTFSDDTNLYFNDMRLFGYTKLATTKEVEVARAKFGPEPIAKDFSIENFIAGVRKRSAPIKAILLDQSFVAGLGNIYVDEALFRAGIRPMSLGKKLSVPRLERLAKEASTVLKEAIAVGGTTFQHFADTGGNAGNFTDYLRVFGKQGTPCLVCGSTILKTRCAGRGTHYCPKCQKP